MHARKKEQRSFVRLSVPGVPAYAKVSSVDAKMVNRKAGSGQEVDRKWTEMWKRVDKVVRMCWWCWWCWCVCMYA